MHRRSGFTIVELVIVMVIMAILLGLGFVGITRSQMNARDTERKADVENIARGLETRYKEGNPNATSTTYALGPGSYPGYTEMAHIINYASNANITPSSPNGGYGPDALPGTSVQNYTPPSLGGNSYNGFVIRCLWSSCPAEDAASINTSVTKDVYLYEAIDASGNVCAGDISNSCVRFNLYYREEVTGNLITIRSKHQ